MNILNLVNKVSEVEKWDKVKTSNVKTCARRFARVLGYDPKLCYETSYNISDQECDIVLKDALRNMQIANPTYKNTKSQLKLLFNCARKHGLIKTKEVNKLGKNQKFKCGRTLPPVMNQTTGFHREPYALRFELWNESLKSEFTTYVKWATSEYEETRGSRKIRKTTILNYKNRLECYLGYIRRYENIEVANLNLSMISNLPFIKRFVKWHIEERMGNRITSQVIEVLRLIRGFCNNYPKVRDKQIANEVSLILKSLGKPKPVLDKSNRILTFQELMTCAISEFPSNNQLYKAGKDRFTRKGIKLANQAGRAVAMMLLTTVTLRNQNWREAQAGKHIYKDQDSGKWYVSFRGDDDLAQLKKTYDKNGNINIVHREIHSVVVPFLEEYINFWRPIIINCNIVNSEDINYVFLDTKGKPYDTIGFSLWIQRGTYNWSGKRINPHNFRHSIATQDIIENGEPNRTAELLNDEPQTVYQFYYLPNKDELNKKTYEWMNKKLDSFKKKNEKKSDDENSD